MPANNETSVLTLVGSVRQASANRRLAKAAAATAPEGIAVNVFDGLSDIPFYNEELDVEGKVPAVAAALREAAAESDALLLVSPEYNGTIPAVLKNAIDWLSRPHGAGALFGKPVAVVGTAAGRFGGTWAHDEARKSAGIAGAVVVENATLSLQLAEVGTDEVPSAVTDRIVEILVALTADTREEVAV